MAEPLSAPYTLTYAYKRSLGPVLTGFLTAMRDGQLMGVKAADGRVLCPPLEYDPKTGESLTELVPVGPGGEVTTWCWVNEPRASHPLDRPFAFAMVKLDGADTALLHAVDAGDPSRMASGMRVRPRWRRETRGEIHDIECFEPEA